MNVKRNSKSPIAFTYLLCPMFLDSEEYPNEYYVSGWGRTNNKRNDAGDRFDGGAHANVLQKLKLPLILADKCKEDYKAYNVITSDKQVCAGGERGNCTCLLYTSDAADE